MRDTKGMRTPSSFEDSSTFSQIIRIFRIFPSRDRRKILLVALIQVILTLLDLVGVALIGVIGSLSVTGIQSRSASGRIYEILVFFNIEKLPFQTQVAILGSISIALFVSKTLLSIFLIKRTLHFMARKSAEISARLTGKLLSQDLQEIKMKSSQDLLFAINAGVNAISLGIVGTLVMLTSDIVLFVVMSLSLFVVSFSMAITSLLIFGGVSTLLYIRMRHRAQQIGQDSMLKSIRINELVAEVINTYREAIVRNRREWYQSKINFGKFEVAKLNAELSFLPNVSKYVIESVMILSLLIVASIQFLTGTASTAIGVTAVFLAATSRIAPAALRIQQGAIQVKNNLSYAAPALEVLALDQDLPTAEKKIETHQIELTNTGDISVNHVSFAYSNNKKSKTISDVSFEIPFGSSFALVGPSGSGKSTLIDLILGLMAPDSGKIEIGGQSPINVIESRPGYIGYVPQNTFLIEGSIKENIALGFDTDKFQEAEFSKAIKVAQLEDYVNGLPDGLETKVGENGARISGGQRQRIGIARAIITDPKILVLDEATSSLDSTTEHELVQAIEDLKKQVTVIVIAHRLSTIKKMDQIAYLERGKIKAIGSFNQVKRKVPNFGVQAKLMGL
jgi:ABC-type multidrug transport system fused ATPase/permease subunit